ncbi:MAG: CDP-alcohol phosphatidyltransferase family protein [Pseudomonadota bacterium]
MFDGQMRKVIDPPVNWIGRKLASIGITANAVTLAGLAIGLGAAAAIALESYLLGLILITLSRIADGLDGAVARATSTSDFGGYLDIVCDFLFYGAIPLAFAIAVPEANAVAAAFLITSFYFNGATFLGFAILAEKKEMKTDARGTKSLYYTGGLLEGTETIAFFLALCLFPTWFAPLAYAFGALCFVTATSRIMLASKVF